MSEDVDEFLAHYGIPGMKWGKHKAKDPSTAVSSSPKPSNREAKRKAKSDKILVKANATQKQIDDLEKNGVNSKYLRDKYGDVRNSKIISGHAKQDLIDAELKNLKGLKAHYEEDAKLAAAGKFTNKEKMLIGAAAATVVLAGAAGVAVYANTGDRAKKRKYYKAKAERLAKEAAAQKRLDDIVGGQRISYDDFNKKTYRVDSSRLAGISQDAFHKLDDTPISVPAGHVFKRVSTSNEETLRKEVYATFKDEDVTRYKAMLPKYWNQWGIKSNTGGGYVVEMKAKEAIVSPSKKARVQHFIDLMDEPITSKDFHGNPVTQTGRQWLDNSALSVTSIFEDKSTTTKLSNKEAALKSYGDFASSLVGDSPLKTAYFNKLKSKGYNALIDDNDAGRLSDAPMLIFDTNKSMQRIGATKLTTEAIEEAKNKLVELMNRS